jgi:ubiquinone/menaquinone biosynthesis C-methylase UbiE
MKADVAKFVRFCDSLLGKQILRKEAAYIYNELQGSETILDVGCGIGSFEQHLPTLNIIGLDISEDMLEEARKRSDKTFIQGNATDLEFHDSTFDAVFTVTTLEFLDDYQKAVQEIARVTNPRGKLVVMMLNPHSEYFRENVRRPGDYFQRIKHTNTKEMREYVSRFYVIRKEDLFLGIQGEQVFKTDDENFASLYVLVGTKKE